MKNDFVWPIVAVVCACIIASGIYFGLKKVQIQTPPQAPGISSSINDKSSTNRNLADAEKNEKNGFETGEQLKQQQQKLDDIEEQGLSDIDKRCTEERRKLESHYSEEFMRLEYSARVTLINLDAAQSAAYAKFQQELKNTISESQGYAAMDSYIWDDGYASGQGDFSDAAITPVDGNKAKDNETEKTRIGRDKADTLGYYQQSFIDLQNRRMNDMSVLAKKRKGMIDMLLANINSAKRPRREFEGIVTGIMFSGDNISAVIGDSVVHEGDTTHGVKIVKIYKDRIELEKNGRRWSQQIGDTPDTAWRE